MFAVFLQISIKPYLKKKKKAIYALESLKGEFGKDTAGPYERIINNN